MSTKGINARSYEIQEDKRQALSSAIVDWYHPSRRPFAWRQSSNLYFVTVCEVLLQRTNAEKVAIAVEQLFTQFPEPKDLAHSDSNAVALILQPLGLPRRVEQVRMIAAAFAEAEATGRSLGTEELYNLPGVGPYVLSAVKILVLGEVDAVIDEHVLRIFRRVYSVHAPERRHPTKALIAFARSLVPAEYSKEYNLGILDLGRLICRPTNPKCAECPLRHICDYAKTGGYLTDRSNPKK